LSDNRTVYVDMDGVLVDFIGRALLINGVSNPSEFLAKRWPKGEWAVENVLKISTTEFWDSIDSVGIGFWNSLTATTLTAPLLELLNAYDVDWCILTTPSRHYTSAAGKVQWIQRHLGEGFRNYIFCATSKAHLARPGALLIDDGGHNLKAFTERGGDVVPVPRRWNEYPESDDLSVLYQVEDWLRA